jgi:hypothetical protein
MTSKDRIQYLLITHLLKEGQIQLALPSGLKISLGITKETKHGVEKCDDYCWLLAEQDDKTISLDAYNLGLECSEDRIVFQNKEDNRLTVDVI